MDIKKVYKSFVKFILEAEKLKMNGIKKRDYVVEALNNIIDIPWIPEKIEEKLFGLMVDIIIEIINSYFGKDWIDKVV